mmetsp:Transcript_47927/g.74853  ORF Transcript_47927/g.74853 Transcript_47927/m.74853 type:complete len:215 (-) Transcript_47927:162-806(-)
MHPTLSETNQSLRYLAKMRPFKSFKANTPLKDIALALSSGSHIVGIQGGGPQFAGLKMVASQKTLFQALAPLLAEVSVPVSDIWTPSATSVECSTPAVEAFSIMADKGISGLAVVDSSGILKHNTSARDIKQWVAGKGAAEELVTIEGLSIEEFLTKLRGSSESHVSAVAPDDKVSKVVEILQETGFHRVWVVEDRKPTGLISFTDIFKKLARS